MKRLRFTIALVSLAAVFPVQVSAQEDTSTPMQYQTYNCGQLLLELSRVDGHAFYLARRIDRAEALDVSLDEATLILFREYDAIRKASVMKKCPGYDVSTTEEGN